MKVTAIECTKCGTTIYSRTRHDFHECPCGNLSIDGGREYLRYSWRFTKPEPFLIEVDVTKKELYEDWNHRRVTYGWIAKESPIFIFYNFNKGAVFLTISLPRALNGDLIRYIGEL